MFQDRESGDNIFVVAFIADIHFGAVKSNFLYDQLKKHFLSVIEDNPVDMIVFGGDMFHNIITMNYSTSHIVLMFMENVIELCKKKNIKYIRVIQGTVSHDNNQLHNFHMFEDRTDVDFKIIMSVTSEVLSNNINVLYLPEEYMKNPEIYYEDYLDHPKMNYDFIFGHGMVEEVAFVAKSQESENTMSKAPIFSSKKLFSVCNGPVLFGHIHQRTEIKNKMFYPGSFTRWKHREEEPKGWYLCAYNMNDKSFLNTFIENPMAPVYITVSVDINDENHDKPEIIVETIKKIEADFVKLVIITGEVDSTYAIQYITGAFKNSSNIKIEVKDSVKEKHDIEEEEIMDELMNKYGFVFKEGMDFYEIIQSFIKVKKDKDIPIEIIRDELVEMKDD